MAERRAPPPHYEPPPPVAWLLSRPRPVQLALLFAYWLYLGATGVMAGMRILPSLILGALGLGVMIASYLAMVEARRFEWQDEPRETAWRILAIACGVVSASAAAIVVLVLALWALASLPLWLYRR